MKTLRVTSITAAAVYVIVSLIGANASFAAGSHGGGHGKAAKETGHMQGGHMKGRPMQGGHGHSFNFGEPGKASEVTRTVEIVMKENFYEPEEIEVKSGETIRFKITNEGELVHEFNLGTNAMHVEHQKEMMMMVDHGVLEADKINHHMMKMDMGGGKTMEHDDPNSVLLEPGKSGEIIWKFTTSADLEFACNVPGHYDAGMMGNIHFK